MKKSLLFILSLAFIINAQAQQKSSLLQEHIDAGKKAYRQYANKTEHEKIKTQKTAKSYIVGDTKVFWNWDFSVMPPTWVQDPATCRAVGEHSYVFVADDQWNVNMNQTDVDEVLFRLEDETLNSTEYGIVEMDTLYFGDIPDELDNDPKVIFFFSRLGSFNGTVFDGYFSSYNQMTEAEAQADGSHSNECEMLYMSCDPVNPTATSTLSVLSHELEHLIHWGYDTDEETWLDEGCAELAMVLYGHPDPIVDFPSNPNNNLIVWDQTFSDYVQTMLFFTYLSEQYGSDLIKEIVANTENSVTSINTVLANNGISETFTDIFNNWTIANFLDDTNFESGLYGYESLDLPDFGFHAYSDLPINTTKNINDCAAVYYRIPLNFNEIDIEVTSGDAENSILHLLTFEAGNIREIITDEGDLNMFFSQPETYTLSNLFLVAANQRASNSTTNFTINISDPTVSINEIAEPEISLFPNIIQNQGTVSLSFEENVNLHIDIYDAAGKHIKTIFKGKINSGNHKINFNTAGIKSGFYFLKIISNNKTKVQKFFVE